jgi:hypothetical protein
MRSLTFQIIVAMALLVSAAHARADWRTLLFTNATVITNSRVVLSALSSGDAKSKSAVQALIGSQVAFSGYGPVEIEGRTKHINNLMVSTNILLDVEVQPPLNWSSWDPRQHVNGWDSEVLGTLKSVDFDKRIIYIKAKPENYHCMSGE